MHPDTGRSSRTTSSALLLSPVQANVAESTRRMLAPELQAPGVARPMPVSLLHRRKGSSAACASSSCIALAGWCRRQRVGRSSPPVVWDALRRYDATAREPLRRVCSGVEWESEPGAQQDSRASSTAGAPQTVTRARALGRKRRVAPCFPRRAGASATATRCSLREEYRDRPMRRRGSRISSDPGVFAAPSTTPAHRVSWSEPAMTSPPVRARQARAPWCAFLSLAALWALSPDARSMAGGHPGFRNAGASDAR
jgi:hypothetical protein